MASSPRIAELRKKFEENPRRYFAPLANEYRKAGEIEQAIGICREYLPQQPGHMSGHIVFGQALYEARQFEEAKAVFETALSLDPENLIALRHLGDIALIVGDTEAARGWYRRVLEADPRNEEIQSQLATLDQAASAGAAPTPVATSSVAPGGAPTPATKPATPPKPTPSSAPTVVMSAARPPMGPPAVKAEASVDRPLETVTPESPTAEVKLDQIAPPAATPALELESPVAGATTQEATPAQSFSLEGLETTSLAPGAPAAPPPPAPLPDLDFAAPHAAEARQTPAPRAPIDLKVAVPSDSTSASVTGPVTPVPELDLADLGPPAPAPSAAAPAPAAPPGAVTPPAHPDEVPLELEIAAPTASAAPTPAQDLQIEATPVLPAVAQPPDAGPFVTETMAELYLQQGHRDEAVRVYKALVAQRPTDAPLRAKLSRLEEATSPQTQTPPMVPSPGAGAATTSTTSRPTIREVLSLVALRRPGFRPEPLGTNGAPPAEAPAEHAAPLAADGMGALLGSQRVSPEDEAAALALSLAFSARNGSDDGASRPPRPEPGGITGAPARPAATELSLDSVFGGGEARPPAAPSSFSFDQFFSQRATAEQAPGQGAESGQRAGEPQSDVAQFTQWLEGLKQR